MEFLQQLEGTTTIIAAVAVLLIGGYVGAPLIVTTIAGLFLLLGLGANEIALGIYVAIALVMNIKPIRAILISSIVMKTMKAMGLMPKISPTERTALEAGVVWREADLFSGKPDFKRLMNEPYPDLNPEEQAFIDGPTEQLCKMIDDFQFFKTKVMPPEVFEFIRRKGFLGMIIPKEYGGLGFSPSAHSAVVQKISSRSVGAVIYVMVPNSLGPAELLLHYGTDAQKNKYLPRLAKGDEIPCFGLTEPTAGSDAGSITSEGVVFKGDDGKLYVRVNWSKRWITLAAISTLLGVAFRLRDPQNLLGKGEDVGITCALIPANLPGVVLGRRHDPLGIPFHNCPMEGKDVVINAEDCIIGGIEHAGKGWEMLMDCLAAGRGISLPAQAVAAAKLTTRVCTAHGTIRKQFGVSIGKFEGVEEPMARIVGTTYLLEAVRRYVLSALDQGLKPPVVTAMIKYQATELGRKVVNDGMDIMGGAGISMGPRNLLAVGYIGLPISITVEGANILTRTLMVFGQGALRCHPWAFKEVNAVEKGDLKGFDEAFWGHMGHIARNSIRTILLTLTRGHIFWGIGAFENRRHFQKLAWASASFAILADLSMGLLGGKLKVKEKITGRFADILSWMFMASAVLRRYEAEGRRKEDRIFVDYAMKTALSEIQKGFDGLYANLDVPVIGLLFRYPVRWWSRLNALAFEPSDELGQQISAAAMDNAEMRDRLSTGIFIGKEPGESMHRLDTTYLAVKHAEAVDKKVRKAVKKKVLKKVKGPALYDNALKANVITQEEFNLISESEKMRWDAIQVDDFSAEEYLPGHQSPSTAPGKKLDFPSAVGR